MPLASRGDAEGLGKKKYGNGGATYPCPLTTSSFASCRQMLLRVPEDDVSPLTSISLTRMCAHHICDCWKMVVVVVDEGRSCKSTVGLKRP